MWPLYTTQKSVPLFEKSWALSIEKCSMPMSSTIKDLFKVAVRIKILKYIFI
jgi:hypothetical protein